jgi:hypothetical protein
MASSTSNKTTTIPFHIPSVIPHLDATKFEVLSASLNEL